jgi:hypothetical protein
MYWIGHLTTLSDEAEGWLDLDGFQAHGRDLIERSMAAAG